MVDELRELVRRDRDEAKESERLHSLDAEVAELRRRGEAIGAFFTTERDEEQRLRLVEQEARREAERRAAEVLEAEAELARVDSETERMHAEQRLQRARDHTEIAARAGERAAEERSAFERTAEELTRELPQLEQRAHELAHEIPSELPAPNGDLIDWASRAHAALFVAASQVDARRERVVREANELATAVLGESIYGSTPEQALAQVERYWTSSPGHVSESR
jgi:translation initiation factor IF-2